MGKFFEYLDGGESLLEAIKISVFGILVVMGILYLMTLIFSGISRLFRQTEKCQKSIVRSDDDVKLKDTAIIVALMKEMGHTGEIKIKALN